MDLVKERLYYTIGEVSDILDLNPSTIRYWEKHFPILKPSKRTGSSKRKFDLGDVQAVYTIMTLLRQKNLTIKKARAVLENWKPEMTPEDFIRTVNESKRPKITLSAAECDRVRNILHDIRKSLASVK